MIRFDILESEKETHRLAYLLAKPFPHLVLDGICEEEKLSILYDQVPDLQTKSRDYVFAANKFERSRIRDISPLFAELHQDLTSTRFRDFLQFISNEDLFVDEAFHGGGLHQGKKNSFLDMHLDFNYHPLHPHWYRSLNLLLYLNRDWKPEYGGQLLLEDLRTGAQKSLEVPFNRLIIQCTNRYTLHGYRTTNFPENRYRTSIAAYAYAEHRQLVEKPRTTDWHPDDGQPLKKLLALMYDPAIKLKNKIFGSSTAKN